MGSPLNGEYPYGGYADEKGTQSRGGIVSRGKGKVCDKEEGAVRVERRAWNGIKFQRGKRTADVPCSEKVAPHVSAGKAIAAVP
jgi:hypothetical protein